MERNGAYIPNKSTCAFPICTMGNPDLVIHDDQAAPSVNTLNCVMVEELPTCSSYTHYRY